MHARLGELLARPDQRIAVAARMPGPDQRTDGAMLGGWMHVARHIALESGEFAEILGLIVDPAARRAGVGRALVAEAERWARLHRLACLTVRSNVLRGEPHTFYPALGFSRSKSQHVYAKSLGADIGAVA
jgi:GNAT superfamily N-acetyltransferase